MGDVREELADLEHEQWAHWTRYMLDEIRGTLGHNTTWRNSAMAELFEGVACVQRWRRQIETPYSSLADKEKDSDREWADRVLDIIRKRDAGMKPRQLTLAEAYPAGPPAVKDSDTSEAAARSVAGVTGRLRSQILDFIRCRGAEGATDDEIEAALGLRHQTASARRRELVLLGWVTDSGTRRRTRSGRTATVWILAEEGE